VGCTEQNLQSMGWDSREGSVMTAERVTIFGQPTNGKVGDGGGMVVKIKKGALVL